MSAALDALLVVSTALAALTATGFTVYYMSRLPWRSSHMGRSVVSLSAAVAVMAWIGILRRIDEYNSHVDLINVIRPAAALIWLLIAAVMVYRIYVVRHGPDDRDHL